MLSDGIQKHGARSWLVSLLGFALLSVSIGAVVYRAVNLKSIPGEVVSSRFDPTQGFSDFHNAVYFPVRAVLTGTNPYSPEYMNFHPDGLGFPLYSPTSLLVHLPIGFLQIEVAEVVYFVFNMILLLIVSIMIFRYSRLPYSFGSVMLVAAVMLICRPGAINFYGMQMSLLLIVGCLLALEYAKNSPMLAGFGLMLAFCKPTFMIPLAVMMLARGNVRAVCWGVLLSAISSVGVVFYLCSVCGGLESFGEQVRLQYFSGFEHPDIPHVTTSWARVDAYSILPRWGVSEALHLNILVPFSCLFFGCIAILLERVPSQKERVISRSGVLILLVMLASMYHQPYDCLVMWIPIVAIVLGADKLEFGYSLLTKWVLLFFMLLPMYNVFGTKLFLDHYEVAPDSQAWRVFVTVNAMAIVAAAFFAGLRMMFTSFSRVDRNMAKLDATRRISDQS